MHPLEYLTELEPTIVVILVTYIIWILTGFLFCKKTKGIEFVLMVVSVVWLASHIYAMILSKEIDWIFNMMWAMSIAEIAWIRNAKRLKSFIQKGLDAKELLTNSKKWQ